MIFNILGNDRMNELLFGHDRLTNKQFGEVQKNGYWHIQLPPSAFFGPHPMRDNHVEPKNARPEQVISADALRAELAAKAEKQKGRAEAIALQMIKRFVADVRTTGETVHSYRVVASEFKPEVFKTLEQHGYTVETVPQGPDTLVVKISL